MKVFSPGVVEIKFENGKVFKVNRQRLKPYFVGEIISKGVMYPLGNPTATWRVNKVWLTTINQALIGGNLAFELVNGVLSFSYSILVLFGFSHDYVFSVYAGFKGKAETHLLGKDEKSNNKGVSFNFVPLSKLYLRCWMDSLNLCSIVVNYVFQVIISLLKGYWVNLAS